MKKSILAILLALVMLASLLPFGALADDGTVGAVPNTPTGSENYFFANGVPITISATLPDGVTEKTLEDFKATGNDAYISWLENDVVNYIGVSQDAWVFGGADGRIAPVTVASTSITMNGGTIDRLFGGNYGEEGAGDFCSEVTGNVSIALSGNAVVLTLLHGAGARNTCVNGTVYMTFNGVDLKSKIRFGYINGGSWGNGNEGTRDIENGTMETDAVANNVVITGTNSKFALIGVGPSGSAKVVNGSLSLTNCEVGNLYFGAINGVTDKSSITLNGCKVDTFCSTNRGFVGDAVAYINDTDIKTFRTGAANGCFSSDSGTPDGSGVTGSVTYNIDAGSTVKDAALTPLVVRDNDSTTASIGNITLNKEGEPIELMVNSFVTVYSGATAKQTVEDFIVPDGSTVNLRGANVEVTAGQTLTNMGVITLDSDKAITIADGAAFYDGGTTNATVVGDDSNIHKYVAKVGNDGYDSLDAAMAAAKSGNTVTLLDDVVISSAINVPAGVTIDGNSKTIRVATTGYTGYVLNFAAADCTNVKLYNLTLDGNGNACALLKVSGGTDCSGLYAENVAFQNAKWGVYLSDDSGNHPNADNIKFVNCAFENLTYAGIYAQRGNIAVEEGYFNNIETNDDGTAAGILIDTAYFGDNEYSLSVTDSVFNNIDGTNNANKATGAVSFTGSGTVSKFTMMGNRFSGNTIDLRIGKDTAPTFTKTNIDNNGNINVVAAPGAKIFTATFYSDNSLYETIVTDGTVTMPAIRKSGYAFLGWVSGGKTYLAGETVTITANTTYTASWVRHPDTEYVPEPEQPEQPETPVFPFYDVPTSAWYYTAVKYVYDNKLMDGVDTYVFAPNDTLTRAMVWTIIARMSGVDTTGGNSWYAKAQEWVITNGISDGENPTAAITREQLVTMLYRYAQIKGYDVSVGENTNILSYVDATSISEYAMSAFQWACGSGLTEGDENGALTPLATATRAQAAAMIMRFCQSVK